MVVGDLFWWSLLNGDAGAVRQVRVQGGGGCGNEEGDPAQPSQGLVGGFVSLTRPWWETCQAGQNLW